MITEVRVYSRDRSAAGQSHWPGATLSRRALIDVFEIVCARLSDNVMCFTTSTGHGKIIDGDNISNTS